MAEIELSVLTKQSLYRMIESIDVVRSEVKAWEKARNSQNASVHPAASNGA